MVFAPLWMSLGIGCAGYPPTFDGSPVWRMFPFDGDRTWDYTSSDTSLPHKLITNSVDQAENINGSNVYTLSTVKECFGNDPDCVDGELQWRTGWSSSTNDGVFIWSYSAQTTSRSSSIRPSSSPFRR